MFSLRKDCTVEREETTKTMCWMTYGLNSKHNYEVDEKTITAALDHKLQNTP